MSNTKNTHVESIVAKLNITDVINKAEKMNAELKKGLDLSSYKAVEKEYDKLVQASKVYQQAMSKSLGTDASLKDAQTAMNNFYKILSTFSATTSRMINSDNFKFDLGISESLKQEGNALEVRLKELQSKISNFKSEVSDELGKKINSIEKNNLIESALNEEAFNQQADAYLKNLDEKYNEIDKKIKQKQKQLADDIGQIQSSTLEERVDTYGTIKQKNDYSTTKARLDKYQQSYNSPEDLKRQLEEIRKEREAYQKQIESLNQQKGSKYSEGKLGEQDKRIAAAENQLKKAIEYQKLQPQVTKEITQTLVESSDEVVAAKKAYEEALAKLQSFESGLSKGDRRKSSTKQKISSLKQGVAISQSELENARKSVVIRDSKIKTATNRRMAELGYGKTATVAQAKSNLEEQKQEKERMLAVNAENAKIQEQIDAAQNSIEAGKQIEKDISKVLAQWDAADSKLMELITAMETSANNAIEKLKESSEKDIQADLADKQTVVEQRESIKNARRVVDKSVHDINAEQEVINEDTAKWTERVAKSTQELTSKRKALNDANSDLISTGDLQREQDQDYIDDAKAEKQETDNLINSFDRFKDTLTTYLSIGAIFGGLRKVINQTWEDTKNLDQAFASIAMVTDYSVKEMWSSYDQYSEMAQKLGQSTEDVIKSSALFYQQGLDTTESLKLTESTMKLATLAGADFETATEQMTAALRGFHMEMDQGSHITDVYSELAAKAAADVNGIAYAMSKTASIASSAGMAFETTSAFLTQMINFSPL